MKRLTAFFGAVCLTVCLTACRPQPDYRSASTVEQASEYRSLTCREVSAITWKTVRLVHPSSGTDVCLDIPADWTFLKQGEDTYEIRRDGGVIGCLTTAVLPSAQERLDSVSMEGDLHKTYQVFCYREAEQNVIYRTLRFVNMQQEAAVCGFYFKILYAELDDAAAETLVASLEKNVNTELLPPDEGNGSRQLLIAGNSFVSDSSSQIGTFLNAMLAQGDTGYTATVVCKGGQGLQAFSSDEMLLQRIRSGEFCYVFQCGFYSNDAAYKLSVIQQACDVSNTKLVIFPAHNEQEPHVTTARLGHDRAYFLDWKSEVQSFIDSGMDREIFCYNDYHQHSTAMAGYIGAHMIYRSLFKAVPPELTDPTLLTTAYVRTVLGTDYVDTLPERPTYETYTLA